MKLNEILSQHYAEGDPFRDPDDQKYVYSSPLNHSEKGLDWVDDNHPGSEDAYQLRKKMKTQYEKETSSSLGNGNPNRFMNHYNMVEDVPIDSIIGTEVKLDPVHMWKLKLGERTKGPGWAFTANGRDYIIIDGNHRVAAAKMAGQKSVKLYVIDLRRSKEFSNET
jgi:hypothetical protein